MCWCIERVVWSPSLEKIRDYFAFLTLENYVDQFLVVFGVNDVRSDITEMRVKVTETDFQRGKEKTLPILKTLAVLEYHGAPFICHCCQAPRAVFQPGQVA